MTNASNTPNMTLLSHNGAGSFKESLTDLTGL